jgi:hypothetical protein
MAVVPSRRLRQGYAVCHQLIPYTIDWGSLFLQVQYTSTLQNSLHRPLIMLKLSWRCVKCHSTEQKAISFQHLIQGIQSHSVLCTDATASQVM